LPGTCVPDTGEKGKGTLTELHTKKKGGKFQDPGNLVWPLNNIWKFSGWYPSDRPGFGRKGQAIGSKKKGNALENHRPPFIERE